MRSSLSRWIIVVLAVVGAAAFALAVYGGHWWVYAGDGASFEIGPFGSQRCFGSHCAASGFGFLQGVTEQWLRIATATWAAALVAMLALLMLAGAVAAKRVPRLVAKSSLVACACAAVAGGAFVLKFPGFGGLGFEGIGIGRGALLYAVAILCGAVAAIGVARTPLPPQSTPGPQPVAAG